MTDILDKFITLGLGLEKKARQTIEELEDLGAESRRQKTGEEGLPPGKAAQNKVVDEGVRILKEFASALAECRTRIEGDVSGASERVAERLKLATRTDLDVVLEMARLAREKVDELEKRVAELEAGR